MSSEGGNLKTTWDAQNLVAVSIPSAMLTCVVSFVLLLAVVYDGPGNIRTMLAVVVGAMIVHLVATIGGARIRGNRANPSQKIEPNWSGIISSAMVLSLASAAFTVYARFPTSAIQADGQIAEGSSGQAGFAWCFLFASILVLLQSLSVGEKRENQRGLAYIMAPFLALGSVSLGVVWVQLQYLTTDG